MKRILWVAALCVGIDSMGCWLAMNAVALEARLQGRWEIVSVQRDGQMDPNPLGGTLAFAGDTVKFEPSLLQWNSVTSSIVQDWSVSSILPSILGKSAEQVRPAAIPDGSS